VALTPHFSDDGSEGPLRIPRPVIAAAAGLALAVIVLAGAARRTGVGKDEAPVSVAVATRTLTFIDRESGGVGVIDAATRRTVVEVAPGTGGFVRGVLRALVRERRQRGADAGPPFTLTRWRDGRLTLDDSATGRRLELTSFGPDNEAVFDELLRRGR
jgi:putative photosynthetic complex assembly protein